MEIITGAERRWRLEEKLRIVAEVEQPDVLFADVARRHEVSRGLLWNWRGQVRRGELAPEPTPTFLPMRITAYPPVPVRAPTAVTAPAETARVEITRLPAGRHLHSGGCGCWAGDVAAGDERSAPMIVPPSGMRVWLANGHTDMRLSPLGWEYVNLTGDYVWAAAHKLSENIDGLKPLRAALDAYLKAA